MKLPKGIRFIKGSGKYKYTAILPQSMGSKKVHFGDNSYQQYKDSVPISLGGGIWTKNNHMNKSRRDSYISRHEGLVCKDGTRCVDKKYSPAWFSRNYLW